MPTQEWLAQYESVKEKTLSPVDLNQYFEREELAGKSLAVMDIGPCTLPTGRVLVRDPLVFLPDRQEQPYFITAPAGTYRTEVCVIKPDESGSGARYAAVRLRFSNARPVKFYEALVGTENIGELGEDEYFGFNVDAGLGCICDELVRDAFCDFCEVWGEETVGHNLYNHYFQALFEESYAACPEYQREGGDWINWQPPGTEYHLPIFASGFGDGTYPVYWGVDETGGVCQLVVQFIDIQLAYGEDEEE